MSKPSPGFRLNAPQAEADDEVDDSNPFGMIADDIEDPQSGAFFKGPASFRKKNATAATNNNNASSTIPEQSNNLDNGPPRPPLPSQGVSSRDYSMDMTGIQPTNHNGGSTSNKQHGGGKQHSRHQSSRRPHHGRTPPPPPPVPPPPRGAPPPPSRFPIKYLIIGGVIVICLLIGLIVAVAVALGGDSNNNNNSNLNPIDNGPSSPSPPTTVMAPTTTITSPSSPVVAFTPAPVEPTEAPVMEPTSVPNTTLERVKQRGFLKCGVADGQVGFAVRNEDTGVWEGFDVDMCRAVAAAIFGDEEDGQQNVEFTTVTAYDRFFNLLNDDFDMLARTTTHTMQRQVLEARTEVGYSFSIPYLYNGLQFAGRMPYVECADNATIAVNEATGVGLGIDEEDPICEPTRICALDGTTHIDIITKLIPNVKLVSTVQPSQLQSNFVQGLCNVIAGEQFDLSEVLVRDLGYDGDYAFGVNIHSKEPLALVTRNDDPGWSDFVNWVLEALLAAEDEGISSRTSNIIPITDVFGEPFQEAFRNSVRLVGNYGEIYRRHLEDLLPRPVPDRINSGDSGLIYAFPFGGLEGLGSSIPGPTLQAILDRGHLRCGISRRVIFAQFDPTTQSWAGFDVDFCRALSAAIFDGVTDTVVFTDLPASVRFQELQAGNVDVLSRLTTVTLSRDVNEPSTGVGFEFSQPNFYDGLTFGGIPPFAQCADRLDVTSISCRGLLICVNQGTTFEARLKTLFPERFIVPRQSGELTVEGLVSDECNVIAGGVVDVSLTSIRNTGYAGPYQTGSGRYSKDPLALVTRQGDQQWSAFVYWIVSSIFYAEEEGITAATANEMPLVSLFGPLFFNMFRDAIGAVGNYGEIYARQAQADVPRGGLNLVNVKLSGPQHYPFPGTV